MISGYGATRSVTIFGCFGELERVVGVVGGGGGGGGERANPEAERLEEGTE